MATALGRYSQIRRLGASKIKRTSLGWVGSKAGKKGDMVVIDSNGYIDQAAAVSNGVTATLAIAVLNNDIASTVAAAATAALKTSFEKMDDLSTVELQLVNNSDTVIATSAAYEGDIYGLRRTATGEYVVDINRVTTDAMIKIEKISPRFPVGEVGGTALCTVLAASRLI